MFEPYLKSFYIRSTDPTQIKVLKLEVLTNLANETNISTILREFQTYIKSMDKDFVAASIQAIGRCATNIGEVRDTCLNGLVQLLSNRDELVVAESVVVIKKLLQIQPAQHSDIIKHMAKLTDSIQVPMARASILWLIGEYCEHVPKIAPDVLRKMAKSFTNEEDIVKLQIINLAAKLYLTNSKQGIRGSGTAQHVCTKFKALERLSTECTRLYVHGVLSTTCNSYHHAPRAPCAPGVPSTKGTTRTNTVRTEYRAHRVHRGSGTAQHVCTKFKARERLSTACTRLYVHGVLSTACNSYHRAPRAPCAPGVPSTKGTTRTNTVRTEYCAHRMHRVLCAPCVLSTTCTGCTEHRGHYEHRGTKHHAHRARRALRRYLHRHRSTVRTKRTEYHGHQAPKYQGLSVHRGTDAPGDS
ncbi:UNVERIFIED_CONTAM: hypothetical protein FKN15_031141 [Acipenser sinensis]